MSKAWADGKFANVRTGRCTWFAYKASDGTIHKVQGAWELAFVYWLDMTGLTFTVHRGRLFYYSSDGRSHWWMPDFWVQDWNAWVDVKCDHFYSAEKFDAIRKHNPADTVKVLRLADLTKLGVSIYGKSRKYLPYLKTLMERTRVQPRAKKQ